MYKPKFNYLPFTNPSPAKKLDGSIIRKTVVDGSVLLKIEGGPTISRHIVYR